MFNVQFILAQTFVSHKKLTMAQNQITNVELMNVFVEDLLKRGVESLMVTNHGDDVYMTVEDGQRFDELLCKEKLIEAKIHHFQKEKRKARQIMVEYKKRNNLKTHLPNVLKSNVIDMISSVALTKLLETNFSDEKSFTGLVSNVNRFCDHIKSDLAISDTEEKIFDSEEESMACSKTKTKRKAKSSNRQKKDKRQRTVSCMLSMPNSAEEMLQMESDNEDE